MNRYDSKTGVTMFIIMALLCFATIFFYILWATSGIWIPAVVSTVILLLGYCPIYFCTNYEIDSTYLHLRMGFFKKKIPLEKIEAIYPTTNWTPSFATSYQRVAIIYNENGAIKKTYVSPFLYASFLNDLTDLTLDSVTLINPTNRKAFIEQQSKIETEQPTEKETKKPTTKTKKPAARKVGRPKKAESKKPVGRPRKTESNKQKRPVGRPKKVEAKRKVGRPKKAK